MSPIALTHREFVPRSGEAELVERAVDAHERDVVVAARAGRPARYALSGPTSGRITVGARDEERERHYRTLGRFMLT